MYKYIGMKRKGTETSEEGIIPKRKRQTLVNWSTQKPASKAYLLAGI